MGLMDAGGGLTVSKLEQATAVESDVSQGKTFYSGNKNLRTGALVERGQYQYAGGIAWTGTYLALNNIPEGIYRKNGADWAPEIRYNQSDAVKELGMTVYHGSSVTASKDGWYCVCASATIIGGNYNPDPSYSTNGSNVRVITDTSTGNANGGHGGMCVIAFLKTGQYLNITFNGWGHYSECWVMSIS